MKSMSATHARGLRFSLTISATERPWCRTLATSALKSCTAPMKIPPSTIQSRHGSQPNWRHAAIGPTMGPAAAIALKCWPKR
jgi:hypothetical protein